MKKKKLIIYVVILLFLVNGLPALADETHQAAADKGHKKKEKSDNKEAEIKEEKEKKEKGTPFFKAVWQDEGRIFSSPFRIKGKQFLIWGGTLLVTGILIANDETIYRNIKDYQAKHKWVDDISPKVTKLGLGEWNLGIAGMFYLGGALFKDKKAKETARLTLMTFIHTSVVVQLGKHLFGRQRPSWENGIDRWHGPSGFFKRYNEGQLARYDAFPSGHTISIFGTATVIAHMYKNTVWVPILSYSLATLCGLSRITEDTHWLSEVFLAAVMGYAIGRFVVKRRNRLFKRNFNIYPVANSHQVGIGAVYSF
jgi:membrane-associated phospholipid phosphatase